MTTSGASPRISCAFDSGAIEVVADRDAANLSVRLRADSHADFRQWFHFRLQGVRGQSVRIRFLNAGEATYVEGWRGYQVVASYDREDWFRVPYDVRRRRACGRARGLHATASTTPTSSPIPGSATWRCWVVPMPRRGRACGTSVRRSKAAT
jgi:hypothetical protein